MSAPIEVLEVRRVDAGNLRAFVKVRLGAVVIHGVRVVQQPGQRPWVALPQVPARRKADGSGAGWFPVIEITRKELLDRVRDAVLEAWQRTQDAPPAREAERGRQTSKTLEERAEQWSKRKRDEHVQELASHFDERGPDSVDDL